MAHELNVTKYWINKKGEKVLYNEPSVKSSKHPTKLNPRYLKKFKTEKGAVKEAISISDDTPHFHKKKNYSNEHPKYKNK